MQGIPGHFKEFQAQFAGTLRATFGLEVGPNSKVMGVYVMTQISTNAPGLRPAPAGTRGGGSDTEGGFHFTGGDLKGVVGGLETALGTPVIDESGLNGRYDVDMKWKLSAAEQLRLTTDRRVWQAMAANPNGDWISTLPEELRTGDALEKVKRLKAGLAKPEDEQFRPDPAAVVTATRERLGLQLTLVQRPIEILEVRTVSQ